MLILELEQDERKLLLRVIENHIRELGPEIRHTTNYRFHDELLFEQATLMRLADRMRPMVLEGAVY
jgi:hypothetical protein